MSVHDLISRLDRVKPTTRGNWIARCPAHEDRTPSLTIRELDDGRVLVHCFANCAVGSILEAVGLDYDALFPEKPVALKDGHAYPRRVKFNPHDVLEAVVGEITICALFASDVMNGIAPSDQDCRRFLTAAERIEQARRYANG